MKIRKMLSVLAIGSLLTIMVGCGEKSVNDNKEVANSQEQSETKEANENDEVDNKDVKKVAIVQYMEHPSLDAIREGMIDELAEDGYVDGENIVIEFENSQGDQSNLNSIAGKFLGDDPDVVIAIATPAAQSMAAAIKDTPIVFSAVSDPLGAKLVTDMEKPTSNITGTSDALPMDQTFELIKELSPDAKTIGFIYTASEANSQSIIAEAKEMAAEYGLECVEKTITTSTELQQAAEVLAGKVDVIYTPVDNVIASSIPVLAEVGKKTKIPVYAGAVEMVEQGAYATVGVDYYKLGEVTGDMVGEVLEGKEVSEIPVDTLDNFMKVINKTTADAIEAPSEFEGATIVE